MKSEGPTMELKREYTDDLKKTVIAFANTEGGEILIGVDDDGAVVGVDDADGTVPKVKNEIRDSIRPDVTMFVLCEATELEGKTVVAVKVQRGAARPYYLAGKGIRPGGGYVRQSTAGSSREVCVTSLATPSVACSVDSIVVVTIAFHVGLPMANGRSLLKELKAALLGKPARCCICAVNGQH